jgi:hypothetical protein
MRNASASFKRRSRPRRDIGDPAAVGLSVANGQLVYAAFDLQSNVWLAERREPAAR